MQMESQNKLIRRAQPFCHIRPQGKLTPRTVVASGRLSASTSKHVFKKSRKVPDRFSGLLILGVPFVAMR